VVALAQEVQAPKVKLQYQKKLKSPLHMLALSSLCPSIAQCHSPEKRMLCFLIVKTSQWLGRHHDS
jgi:hypothetical protein